MKYNLTLLALLLNTLIFISCNGQVKPIGEEPLDLENFNLSTKISDLFSEKDISKEHNNVYEIQGVLHSQIVMKDTVFENEYSENKKAIAIEYLQKSSTSIDTIAFFENQKFQKVNVATALNGKIKVINGVADELTKQQTIELYKKLITKYGKAKKFINSWNNKLTIYEWTAEDRIIRFVSAYNDESTTMKLLIDEDKQTIALGHKETYYVGYLFIINSALKEEVFGKMKKGDFVYLDDYKKD
ncbi:hypothetical protein AR687_21325 [Flavobacteriaceae bacterium CRH]|nr:hypothetical protein AR687_21325 [Flavobacteriaceae bacterium CRH]